jgi:hypothetical protein
MSAANLLLLPLMLAPLSCMAARQQRTATPSPATTTRPSPRVEAPPASGPTLDQWVGIYFSTEEVGLFTGTVLLLEKEFHGDGLD